MWGELPKNGLHLFAVYLWHSDVGLTEMRLSWKWLSCAPEIHRIHGKLHVMPVAQVQGKWVDEGTVTISVPAADVSTCRSKGEDGIGSGKNVFERIYDYVVACKSLRSKIRRVELFEHCDSRPQKPVRFEVRCKTAPQQVRILKVPGVSGGKTPSVDDSMQGVPEM